MNDERKTKVYKLEAYFIDLNDVGIEWLIGHIGIDYHVKVVSSEEREIVWEDSSPLNSSDTEQHQAFRELFEGAE